MRPDLLIVGTISLIRIIVGVSPFVAPRLTMKLMKFPSEYCHSGLIAMTRMFGVRDIGLGVLTLLIMHDLSFIKTLIYINAAMDAGDVIAFGLALKNDSKIKSAAVNSMIIAGTAVLAWVVARALTL